MINDFVAAETKDKIKNIIKPENLNSRTVLLLVNAIYFKADWKHKFDKSRTEEKDFYLEGSIPQKTSMMSGKFVELMADIPTAKSKMLRLPYKGDRIVLDILLPNAKENGEFVSVDVVEKTLETTDILQEFENYATKVEVIVSLPKFKIESTHDSSVLKKALSASGMTEMWCDGGQADFSGIMPGSGFCVSEGAFLFTAVQ